MSKITNIVISAVLFFTMSLGIVSLVPQYADAQAKDAVCDSLGGCDEPADEPSVMGVIRTVLNLLSLAAGIIAVIMVVVAGLKFITSQGDSGAISSARKTVIYALVGIVIVLLSQAIVRFVLTEATTPATTPTSETSNPTCVPSPTRSCAR